MKSTWLKIFSLVIVGLMVPFFSLLAHSENLSVKIIKNDGVEFSSFTLPTANLAGGASITAADLGVDGTPEIIVGMGLGNEPRVYVLRQDGSEIGSFLAYAENMGTGINVVTCDINNDGINEIITSAQYGGGPHVRAFNNMGEVIGQDFFAYNAAFRGGVNLACGDIDGNGQSELITAPGPGGGPHLKIWNFADGLWNLKNEFFVFDANDLRGIIPVIKNNGGLLIASQKGSAIDLAEYNDKLILEKLSTVFSEAKGIITGTKNNQEIFFSLSDGKIINEKGEEKFSFETNSELAIFSVDLDLNGAEEIITVSGRTMFGPEGEKQIVVDLSEQRLFAYENGVLANTFLVSAAKYPFTTPTGIYSVLAKKPWVDYTWSYGEGNPNNYSLGLVPWNLNFYGHFYIHYAYWHNNFGHPMSHGCVNVALNNMIWVYEWSEVGTPVEVVD